MDTYEDPRITVDAPICSIIIPTRDKLNFLQPCIDSLLRSNDSNSIEIIVVDNDSEEKETRLYLESLGNDSRFKILSWKHTFNFSAINNFAVEHCNGDVVCFLNNDIEIDDADWLSKLLPTARRTDVGAVGCLLLYPDSSIQHAGIALDEKSIAIHIAAGESSDFFTNKGITVPFAVDAVTAACMLVKKSLFQRLGGFNEEQLTVAYNDVDLCLRMAEKGLPILFHPDVVLTHHESVSRKSDELPSNRERALQEHAHMQFRWRHKLADKNYISGIPSEIEVTIKGESNSSVSLDDIILAAADKLYQEHNITASYNPTNANISASEKQTSSTQLYFRELQENFKNLGAHAKRIERAHSLIENSISWRITAPIRRLKNFVLSMTRRQFKEAKASTDGFSESGNKKAKSSFNKQATRAFERFIASFDQLRFPKDETPKISIILVFYNQAHLSYLCLRSILQYAEVSYQLVIIDNNSSDATDVLLDRIENVTIQRNQDNLGFVKAVNQAATLANGEYLLLLNNDALLESGALKNALACIEADETIGAVGAKIKLLDGSLQEAGSIIWRDGACLGYGRGQAADSPEFMFQRDVDYCSGAFLMFKHQVYKNLGGFDEDFSPAYYEESDFCIRLQKTGLRIVYNPAVQITHYEFASSGGLSGASELQLAHRKILCDKHENFLSKKFPNEPVNQLFARTANTHPKILVIDDRIPYPSLGAGYPRCANFLNELCKLDFDVTFYPLLFPDDNWDNIYQTLSNKIEVILGSGQNGLLSFLDQRQDFYKYIVVSRIHNMEIFNDCLSARTNLPGNAVIIYDAEAVSASREILQQKFLGKEIPADIHGELISKELEQARSAEKIIAVSENEAKIFQDHGYNNTVVLGHSIAASPGSNSYDKRKGFLFVGALRDEDSPNVDSLQWFLFNVLPLIQQTIPDVELHVVGDNSAPSLTRIESDNVIFSGRLESIEEMYNSCRVFIAPTRFAAGIPFKVHEAAAMGLPSVTTALLAEQLGWADKQQLLIADSPKEFADQCIKLYQDAALWQSVRSSGLKSIDEDCFKETFRNSLINIFE